VLGDRRHGRVGLFVGPERVLRELPVHQHGVIGRVAFYPEKVEVYEVSDAAVNPHHAEEARDGRPVNVDEVVRHTDAGGGVAQRERWEATVETPAVTDDGGLR